MGRRPCCSKEGLNRGAWSAREDRILTDYIKNHGEGKWRDLPKRAGLRRCGKSCRLRWLNYLRPGIKRGNISPEEEDLIIRLHKLLGNRWSLIAGRLPGRTDNEIKNYWNTNLSKKGQSHSTKVAVEENQIKSPEKKRLTEPLIEELPKLATHQVIRTKALRCTKVVLPTEGNETSKDAADQTCCDCRSFVIPQDDDSSNFLMDFDVGELLTSEILNSDFLQVCGKGIQESGSMFGEDDGGNNRSSCYDHSVSFNEEMLGDWWDSNTVQANVASELKMWTPFLEFEDDQFDGL